MKYHGYIPGTRTVLMVFYFCLLLVKFVVFFLGVIVTLVPEIVMSSQNSPSIYQNFKVDPACAFC